MKNQVRFLLNSNPQVRDEEKRIIDFIISDETVDRHGTILGMDGWELNNFDKNGIVGYQHDVYGSFWGESNPDTVIGKGRAFIEGEGKDRKLIGSIEFEPADINPLAEKIYKKVKFGTLKATSVGFLPLEKGKFKEVKGKDGEVEEVFHYGKRELLEFSIVNIPSNPNAVKRIFEIEEKNIESGKQEYSSTEETSKSLTEEDFAKLKIAYSAPKEGEDEKNKNKSLQLQKQLISLHEHSL
ncbi:MAG: HK97 family phage prohead protease [Candidatus Anammoxibacter sp.]